MSSRWHSFMALAGLLVLTAACGSSTITGPSSPGGLTTVLSISPASGSVGVSTQTTVTIRFSAAMGSNMENYVVLNEGDITGPLVPAARAWSGDRTTLTCKPSTSLKAQGRYTIHMGGGMTDASGHILNLDGMPGMGGQWVTGNMMMGGLPSYMMGPGWQGPNGNYGMEMTFTTN